jgi:hypothetical protein
MGLMALLHRAELRPSKIELIAQWAPSQAWFDGAADAGLTNVASFRFDDPDGEVGIETLLIRAGDGPVLQVPLTYRGAPLEGGDAWLIGTMQHSVLGQRWVYDGAGDPVYITAVSTAALTGGHQAEQYYEIDGERVPRDPTALVVGSGGDATSVPEIENVSTRHEAGLTIVDAKGLRLAIARVPGVHVDEPDTESETLVGTWTGQPNPLILAVVSTD